MPSLTSSELGLDLLNSKNEITLRLNGYSMFPFLKAGDIGTIKKRSIESLKIGDVIVFKSENSWIAHRLIRKELLKDGYILLAKGDAQKRADKPLSTDDYIGKLTSFNRNGTVINVEGKFRSTVGVLISKTSTLNTLLFVINRKIWKRIHSSL